MYKKRRVSSVDRLEQTVPENSVDCKDIFIPRLLYSLTYTSWTLILIYTSNVFTSIIYIKQVKTFTVNYPAYVPFIPSKHIKCISQPK